MADYNQMALQLHEKHRGKVEVISKVQLKTKDDLSTAYTPGVAEPCRRINENPEDIYRYTCKGNMVAVVSDGTAVLGLGDIGAAASLPVMEGKCVLFKAFGGVDAFPICIDTKDEEEIIRTVKLIAPVFGGINLEDINAPRCFMIEERLKKELDIPVFHDDQHGTAICTLASLINSAKLVKKDLAACRVVISGAGAAGTAVCKILLSYGVKNITVCNRSGVINKNDPKTMRNWAHEELAKITNPDNTKGTLADALKGADIFVGVSMPGLVTREMVASMNKDAIVFAMANPVPEIYPDEAKAGGARVVGTGRSDFPNQVNNVLAFPGVFKGALAVRAREINEQMKLAAAVALAGMIPDKELSETNVLPYALDPRVAETVGEAVAKAARETGVARL
ncbi:MAG: NADP-dependent malic enzyme [Peptococcaceae bacterium]|jgi:malate dehydrogenase (oxaloacetate-decarboxylating)|nr:NADP-dependent malic enzyme [Peptococcaceae bacterium]MDH7526438.1 NADP-dependent malic enzyme [Peptococcaceae bacterium]